MLRLVFSRPGRSWFFSWSYAWLRRSWTSQAAPSLSNLFGCGLVVWTESFPINRDSVFVIVVWLVEVCRVRFLCFVSFLFWWRGRGCWELCVALLRYETAVRHSDTRKNAFTDTRTNSRTCGQIHVHTDRRAHLLTTQPS